MNNFQSLSKRIIHAGPAGIILLIFFASFLNQPIFAESNSTTANNSQKEMKPFSAAPPESPLTKSSCEKTPMQCRSLCQTALSAESQAVKLEKSSKEARANADKAAQKAVSIEKKANKELQKISGSKNALSPTSVSNRSKSLWKTIAIIPGLLVSKEAKARYDKDEKEARKYAVNTSPNPSSKKATELLMKSRMASKSAEESQKVAADAKKEADQARANADSMRQPYKSCLSGMGPQ